MSASALPHAAHRMLMSAADVEKDEDKAVTS